MSDADLILRFRAGQHQAFNVLVWRWQGRLYHFALRYSGDSEDARDLCQQSFIRAYGQLHRLRDPERFSTWLYQIATNLCRDHLRQRVQHVSLDAYEEVSDRPHPVLCRAADMDKVELRDLLNRALQTLPEEQRVVVVLKEYEGLKFREIAEVLDAPLNTVKSRLYYGLKALRKTFNQWDIDEDGL
ncbi:MAG: sigma-70 family RNA polymerase sigma factor [Gemmatimonadota bacterium]|nr:sigma-70 family RNA polymerase sigma factor [Gemmatimonadota bacterium]